MALQKLRFHDGTSSFAHAELAFSWICRRTIFRLMRCFFPTKVILLLGASHAEVFKNWRFDWNFPKRVFQTCIVDGATVSGLENPNSKTQAYDRFGKALATSRHSRVIVLLGEVDTGFVIWYRARKYHSDVSKMLDQAIENYTKFLSETSEKAERVIVISTPLPTIKDGNTWGLVANLRKEVKATQEERTQLTLEFNRRVQAHCKARNLVFIDLDSLSLNENGFVRDELTNRNPLDHHYNQSRYAKILCTTLRGVI